MGSLRGLTGRGQGNWNNIRACLKRRPQIKSSTHRPLSSSCLGLPYRILNINHKKELLRRLWVHSNSETYIINPTAVDTSVLP